MPLMSDNHSTSPFSKNGNSGESKIENSYFLPFYLSVKLSGWTWVSSLWALCLSLKNYHYLFRINKNWLLNSQIPVF